MNPWHTFDVEIAADSPLHLGDESNAGNFLQTLDAIPGSALRGAVAGRMLESCALPDHKADHARCPQRGQCDFWRVFGQQEPLFGYAYHGQSGPAFAFPLTARTCKLYPGYVRDPDRTYHGIYDVLIDQFVYGLLTDPCFPQRQFLQPGLGTDRATLAKPFKEDCPECQSGMQRPDGTYIEREGDKPGDAGPLVVRRATHVGINRARGVAEDHLLYTLETIEPAADQALFHARITAPTPSADTLRRYVQGRYFMGRGRSRGMGGVTLSIQRENAASQLADRTQDFQASIRAALAEYAAQDARINRDMPGLLFSVTLRSPTIIEAFGRSLAQLTSGALHLTQAHLLRAWARTEVVGGWNTAAGLPCRTRLAIQAGSVFVFLSEQPDPATLISRLEAVEAEGVGEETSRGYGQVSVCAPFHLHHRLHVRQLERSQP